MAILPETQARIQLLRQKAMLNTITLDEMREAIKLIRADRVSAAAASAASKTKRVKVEPNAKALLDELSGI